MNVFDDTEPDSTPPLDPAAEDATLAARYADSPTSRGGTSPPRSPSVGGGGPVSSVDGSRFAAGTLVSERYRIVGMLGRGGMGEVYRADDLVLGQSVALKFLPANLAADADFKQRFLSEVRIARQVSHPNVCRVYDIGEVDGHTFLSMEFIDGEDLASSLRRFGRLPNEKALEITRQLCAGLASLHDRGILHRDLKPANVMIDGRGRVRITDFGLAGVAEDIGSDGTVAGTPAYMSPEQLRGDAIDRRSDVYSLGLVLYEVFTGKRPFKADTIAELSRAQLTATPTNPSQVQPDIEPTIESVISRCLEKDPDSRPSSALAVAAALPGADPIAAALAAGEIPSPEMIAAAGKTGRVRPMIAWLMMVTMVVGVLLATHLYSTTKIYRFDPIGKPPTVLLDRARDHLRALGHDAQVDDSVSGMETENSVLRYIATSDTTRDRWNSLAKGHRGAVRFWYRQSPRQLIAEDTWGEVTMTDPPSTVSGMASVVLDTRGRLLEFTAVPVRKEVADTTGVAGPDSVRGPMSAGLEVNEQSGVPETDWSPLFAAAELDPGSFASAEPQWIPTVYADRRAAWTGPAPDDAGVELRLEAASFRGRPVYWQIVGPWTRDPAVVGQNGDHWINRVILVVILTLLMIVIVGAVFMGIRNVRLGRGDKRGGLRLSVFVFSLAALSWLFGTSHVSEPNAWINQFFKGCAGMLFAASIFGCFYMALEPFVRKNWPDQLIGWSRLLTGRPRDPLVGRDILVGGVFFFGLVAIEWSRHMAVDLSAMAPPSPGSVRWESLKGVGNTLDAVFEVTFQSLIASLFFLMSLVILRMICRNQKVAITVFALLISAITWFAAPSSIKMVALGIGIATALLYSFVLFRFGLLPFVVGTYFDQMMNDFPVTLDSSVWYSGVSFFAMGLVLAVTSFGLYTALKGHAYVDPSVRATIE